MAQAEDITFCVEDNTKISSGFFLLTLRGKIPQHQPGQFAMIKIENGPYPLLRRPFAVCESNSDTCSILYRVRGLGTSIMTSWKKGKRISAIFPLGKGFHIPQEASSQGALLIGGGSGVASLIRLAHELKHRKVPYLLCAGFATDDEVPHSILRELNVEVATEDGSCGYRGTAVSLAAKWINSYRWRYLCGPEAMIYEFLKTYGSERTQVSLESRMGCGTGVCLGCAVSTRQGFKRVCYDGPVFQASILE